MLEVGRCYIFNYRMLHLPTDGLSPEAADFLARIRPKISVRLEEVNKVPVGVLIWGPAPTSSSSLATVRHELRQKLREKGHAACFSEELCDPASPHSVRMQQLAQAQEFDLIVSTPCTPGSIAEIHDFAPDRRVHSKVLVFLNHEHMNGYGPQSLIALRTIISCQIEEYPNDRDTNGIVATTLNNVQRIREMKYCLAGRY